MSPVTRWHVVIVIMINNIIMLMIMMMPIISIRPYIQWKCILREGCTVEFSAVLSRSSTVQVANVQRHLCWYYNSTRGGVRTHHRRCDDKEYDICNCTRSIKGGADRTYWKSKARYAEIMGYLYFDCCLSWPTLPRWPMPVGRRNRSWSSKAR